MLCPQDTHAGEQPSRIDRIDNMITFLHSPGRVKEKYNVNKERKLPRESERYGRKGMARIHDTYIQMVVFTQLINH